MMIGQKKNVFLLEAPCYRDFIKTLQKFHESGPTLYKFRKTGNLKGLQQCIVTPRCGQGRVLTPFCGVLKGD